MNCKILVYDEGDNQRSASVAVGRHEVDALPVRPVKAVVGGGDTVDAESARSFVGLENCH